MGRIRKYKGKVECAQVPFYPQTMLSTTRLSLFFPASSQGKIKARGGRLIEHRQIRTRMGWREKR